MLIRNVCPMGDCSMKTIALMFLLLQTTLLATAGEPNPADFPVKVHVVSSGTMYGWSGNGPFQVLETIIDNQAVELQASNPGMLALGDYPAQLLASWHQPKHTKGYDIYRAYVLLLPDGATRIYLVTRLGPAPSHP
jgi:hypothetical protein